MKLRDKKTGEIWTLINRNEGTSAVLWVTNGSQTQRIESIEELTSRFEDYEEPKDFWYIKPNGCIERDNLGVIECDIPKEYYDKMVEIGNYFESEEEAEKAVEKLKAWQRLKKLGFRFIGETCEYKADKHFGSVFYETSGDVSDIVSDIYEDAGEFYDDLDLLFGGEE